MLWRQGDVFIERVLSVPRGAVMRRDLILAEGEITGHSHRIADGEKAALFNLGATNYFSSSAVMALTVVHEEHGTIELSPGQLPRVEAARIRPAPVSRSAAAHYRPDDALGGVDASARRTAIVGRFGIERARRRHVRLVGCTTRLVPGRRSWAHPGRQSTRLDARLGRVALDQFAATALRAAARVPQRRRISTSPAAGDLRQLPERLICYTLEMRRDGG